MRLFKEMCVCVCHGGSEWENNTLKEKMCLKRTQRLDGKMQKLVHECVCLCVHVCDSLFIYRSPLGEKCHYCAMVENVVGL